MRRPRRSIRQPTSPHEHGRLGTPMGAELLQGAVYVVLHRRQLDAQLPCDLLVGQALSNESHDLKLPGGENGHGTLDATFPGQ
ncbi:MAG TPA: hypothetical protein VGP61_09880, partial [Gemmatimonadales bacterium]|nr:hypothetical protein [Gemmatimonadales bacterium]